MTEPIGFVGLGVMGGAMAGRLVAAGFDVAVHDVSEEAVQRLTDVGARACGSVQDVAKEAQVVLLSLPTAAVVQQVVLGSGGLGEALADGALVIDLSSSTPAMTQRCAEELSSRGVEFIDAPVSRGAPAARDGTLAIMVGGAEAAVERCRPIFEVLATDVVHVGPVAHGHAVKALNNHLSATILLAAIEGMLVATAAGVDPHRAVEAINAGSGASHMTQDRFPRYFLPRRFDSGFTIGLMRKDCGIANDMAREHGLPLLFGGVTTQLYQLAENRGWAEEDNTRILEVIEELTSVRLDQGDGA